LPFLSFKKNYSFILERERVSGGRGRGRGRERNPKTNSLSVEPEVGFDPRILRS